MPTWRIATLLLIATSLAGMRELLAVVARKPGAIGYLPAGAPTDGVRVISIRRGGPR